MGKRQIGEMQPFEFVITILIANLACISMEDIQKPLIYGMVAIITLLIVHHIAVLLIKKFLFLRKIFEGTPSIVIEPRGINFRQLKKNRLTLSDLIESMRVQGYFSFEEIAYGIYETNGKFSAISSNIKKRDSLKMPTSPATLPFILIEIGKLNKTNLEKCGIDENWILEELKKLGITGYKSIDVLTLDTMGNVYLQQKSEPYKTFKINYIRNDFFHSDANKFQFSE